jgi:organic radical activating enzyme
MTILLKPQETWLDYPDNESLAIIVFMVGCDNRCVNCQSPFMADESKLDLDKKWLDSKEDSFESITNKIKIILNRYQTNKLVLSGGDPLFKGNIEFTKKLCKYLSLEGIDICIYTGHSIDYVKRNKVKDFKFVKCGKYTPSLKQESFKSDEIMQLASSNQNFYDSEYNIISDKGFIRFK